MEIKIDFRQPNHETRISMSNGVDRKTKVKFLL